MGLVNPSGVVIASPTPYVTPTILTGRATGVSWATYPHQRSTEEERYAAQVNLCAAASDWVDGQCNQPLRATTAVETLTGPGDLRCQLLASGVTRLVLSRFPIMSIVSARYAAATGFPRTWTSIAADQLAVVDPLFGVGTGAPAGAGEGSQLVDLAPGYVTWVWGRMSTLVEVTYRAGWPHASLQAAAAVAATSLSVDDITSWTGVSGTLYDDAGEQEQVTVSTATPTTTGATSGPGTLTLSAGLAYPHAAGTLLSTLPPRVITGCVYYLTGQALLRGATATTAQTTSGGPASKGAAVAKEWTDLACQQLFGLKRRW